MSAADPAGQAAEVSWFDTREVTLGPADLADLDARESARAAAFVFPADRHRYQVAHVMLRRVLAGHLGTEPGQLGFTRQRCPTCGGPSGKPVLAVLARGGKPPPEPHVLARGGKPPPEPHVLARGSDPPEPPVLARGSDPPEPPDVPGPRSSVTAPRPLAWGDGPSLSFSLAHSGEAVAIAVARAPVGIDVEREATGCVCSLVPAMHADDAALAQGLPEPERHAAVIRWWVRAEAVLKCAGTGIAHGMDAFPVLYAPVRSQVPPGAPGWATAAGYSFTALSAPRGYQAALALPGLRLIRYRWGSGGR